MKINNKHRAFIDEYFSSGFNGTLSYMKVYGCQYDTARTNAPKLLADTGIRKIMEEKQAEIAERANIKKENILTKLMEIAYGENTKPADSIRAINEMNRMLGYATDKVEHSGGIENRVIKVSFKKPLEGEE